MNSVTKRVCTAALALGVLAGPALAANVTIDAKLQRFGGRAYAVIYLTKPDGQYDRTLRLYGTGQYQADLREWFRGARRAGVNLRGVTGASAGSGANLTVSVDIADNLIAAGYQVRVDTALEDYGSFSRDAVISLSKPGAVKGTRLVNTLSVSVK